MTFSQEAVTPEPGVSTLLTAGALGVGLFSSGRFRRLRSARIDMRMRVWPPSEEQWNISPNCHVSVTQGIEFLPGMRA